jgi:hypothetical protein
MFIMETIKGGDPERGIANRLQKRGVSWSKSQSKQSAIGFFSSRPNWDLPPPHPQASVLRPGIQRGGQHSLSGEGYGGPNADDWVESITL